MKKFLIIENMTKKETETIGKKEKCLITGEIL